MCPSLHPLFLQSLALEKFPSNSQEVPQSRMKDDTHNETILSTEAREGKMLPGRALQHADAAGHCAGHPS